MTEANDAGPGGSGRDLSEFTVGLDPVLAGAVQAQARLLGVSPRRVIEGAVARALGKTADRPLDLIDVEC